MLCCNIVRDDRRRSELFNARAHTNQDTTSIEKKPLNLRLRLGLTFRGNRSGHSHISSRSSGSTGVVSFCGSTGGEVEFTWKKMPSYVHAVRLLDEYWKIAPPPTVLLLPVVSALPTPPPLLPSRTRVWFARKPLPTSMYQL